MSRGPGKIQNLIIDTLQLSAEPVSSTRLRERIALEIWDPDEDPDFDFDAWNTMARQRSVRMSVGRALRQLEAAGQIKRNDGGDWYPARDWIARDNAERERLRTAYHEAGHAVIGLALRLPVAFVTIKGDKRAPHVSYTPVHYGLGQVYARGSYRKPIADICEHDAFGNVASKRNDDWHADIVVDIAGGMAEGKFLADGTDWRELWSGGDKRCAAYSRSKLGQQARSLEEYAAECKTLVERHWLMIEAVAARLVTEETLSGNDVYAICWRAARNVVRRQHLKRRRTK
jgi:hypothetical protein